MHPHQTTANLQRSSGGSPVLGACLAGLVLSMCLPVPRLLCAEEAKSPADKSTKEAQEGFVPLFDGKTLTGWQGALGDHIVENGVLVCKKGCHGTLFTKKEYGDFILRLQYKLEPGGNNGIGLRAPLVGQPGFEAMEVQILDDSAPAYKDLKPYQFNGSIYGAVAAKRGHMKPVGEWNAIQIKAKGSRVTVTLNGTVITDADLATLGPKRIHGHDLDGLLRPKGYIGLSGHNDRVEFRNIRIKEL